METILRSEKMAEIMLLPVRHHSPACAFQTKRVIESWKPDVVLVEGPDNANRLLSVMVHEDTHAPFAIYYSYHDSGGKISGEKEHYKCYYPFLDYSPELAAIRAAHETGADISFIDLSYGDILAASQEGKEIKNYNDDYLLAENEYIKKLCEKTGLRSFDEFWEKYFELNGITEDGDTWFSHLNTYCKLARENTPRETMVKDGCLAREKHMAAGIVLHAMDDKKKILAVTGGFHTPGLKELLSRDNWKETEKYAENISHYVPDSDESVYLLPYSMEAADALNGYASGMPYSGFYQKIWESILCGEEKPYEKTVLDFLVVSGKNLRKKEENISASDEINAWQMAQGLCSLRNKPQPGAYELKDAVLSSYVKGECNPASDLPLRVLRQLMTGTGSGSLCAQADVPPIIHDFEEQCRAFGIKTDSTLEKQVTLSVFSRIKHRHMSMFFHRMVFLNTDFARRLKGPNLQLKKDKNLIREIWKYKSNAQVFSALVDVSVHGATVYDAVISIVKEKLGRDIKADAAAWLFTRVFEMGIENQTEPVYECMQEALIRDSDFYSVAGALKSLVMLEELGPLYESHLEFESLLHAGIRKLTVLLPTVTRIKDEVLDETMNVLKLLCQITGKKKKGFEKEKEDYFETLEEMLKDHKIHAGLNGCIRGILYGSGREEPQAAGLACRGYLTGTKEQLLKTAVFFRGLFFTARDLMLTAEELPVMLDTFFGQVDEAGFMELLPQLRMAFACFTPAETDKIAKIAAGLHQKTADALLAQEEVLPEWYAYGKSLDLYARKILMESGGK